MGLGSDSFVLCVFIEFHHRILSFLELEDLLILLTEFFPPTENVASYAHIDSEDSINPNPARTKARAISLLIGLSAPLSLLTEASVFSPIISLSPKSRALAK